MHQRPAGEWGQVGTIRADHFTHLSGLIFSGEYPDQDGVATLRKQCRLFYPRSAINLPCQRSAERHYKNNIEQFGLINFSVG